MPQLGKRRRTRWALLAVVALFASLFAVGAPPAGAEAGKAEATAAFNAACSGNATQDNNFTDVSEGHVHRAAINCLVHYGITTGTGDGTTYDPDGSITRSQMALFMQRAANKTGVQLAAVSDQGFADIGGLAQFIQDAANQMAGAGIVVGTSATRFGPNDPVTRGEMARILVAFLSAASARVTTNADGTISVTNDANAAVTIDEVFADSRATQPIHIDRAVSALAELGVARGTTETTFSPRNPVSRAQMAAFVTRALAFTSARPAGISIAPAGSEGADTTNDASDDKTLYTISVRDANHSPVRNARVDTFWIKGDTADVLEEDGTCDTGSGIGTGTGSTLCTIDATDLFTNGFGQATATAAALVDTENPITIWAWTGPLDAEFGAGTEVASYISPAAAPEGVTATEYSLKRSSATAIAAYGSVITVTLQAVDSNGKAVAEAGRNFSGTVTGTGLATRPIAVVTDETGAATFTVGGAQDYVVPTSGADTDKVVTWTLTERANDVSTGGTAGKYGGTNDYDAALTAASGIESTVTFSEAAAVATSGEIEQPMKYVQAVDNNTGGATHSVTVTVNDQYGNGMPNQAVVLSSGLRNTATVLETVGRYTGPDGTVVIPFSRDSAASAKEAISTTAGSAFGSTDVLWVEAPDEANTAASASAYALEAADTDNNEVVVTTGGSTPKYFVLEYDSNDRYNLSDTSVTPNVADGPVTQEAFEEALDEVLAADSGKTATVAWQYRDAKKNTVVEWTMAIS